MVGTSAGPTISVALSTELQQRIYIILFVASSLALSVQIFIITGAAEQTLISIIQANRTRGVTQLAYFIIIEISQLTFSSTPTLRRHNHLKHISGFTT